ncbi:hypothetical protein SAMN05444161_7485 [Rhizobiales bacterium GAS191]|nr:hypothetical protein SAMN05444161_7485 [Rhizobiales bacterium GAS191]
MWSAIASVLLGVAGWLVTSFFGKPWVDFMNLGSQVHEEITYTANVRGMLADAEGFKQAALSLRRFAAKVLATNVTTSPLLRLFLSKSGYDLTKASGGLIGMSNSLGSSDGSLALHLSAVQASLKLPRDYSDEFLRQIETRMAGRSG